MEKEEEEGGGEGDGEKDGSDEGDCNRSPPHRHVALAEVATRPAPAPIGRLPSPAKDSVLSAPTPGLHSALNNTGTQNASLFRPDYAKIYNMLS